MNASIRRKLETLVERLDVSEAVDAVQASNALGSAINRLTFKYRGAWRNMTDAEAEEIGALYQQLSDLDKKWLLKGYKAQRDAMQDVVDAGKGFKGALHQAADEDIIKDMDRMLKAFRV